MAAVTATSTEFNLCEHLLDQVDLVRIGASRALDVERRSELGQFMTPAPVGRIMARMFAATGDSLRILDPGAGVGSLSAALVSELLRRRHPPRDLEVVTYEVDPALVPRLKENLRFCERIASEKGLRFTFRIIQGDFISMAAERVRDDLFSDQPELFDCIITNPPYRKIGSDSSERRHLEALGIGSPNLYSAFLSLSARLLKPRGELVAITPRSFCNGTYFKAFRRDFLERLRFKQLHVFETRDQAFSGDEVLQENVIFHAVRAPSPSKVIVWSSATADSDDLTRREVPHEQVVHANDPEQVIRFAPDALSDRIVERMSRFVHSLEDLGLTVSTGKVVDFRARAALRANPEHGTVPLIYPGHFSSGLVVWPRQFKKPNAIVDDSTTSDLLVDSGIYVLVKRFSAKEEPRRIVAAIFDPTRVSAPRVGFENHLNYFHAAGSGLTAGLARGLSAFLNSTLVDEFFRQLSGHTQVNAGDLRGFKYPSRAELEKLGARMEEGAPSQDDLDAVIDAVLFPMEKGTQLDPVRVKRRVGQAVEVLEQLGTPREQVNERSGLTLLALLDLKPSAPWSKASAPLRGITPMMTFFKEHYGKEYAPNTRETVRRQTVHQFLDAGLIVANPDEPGRATNSGKNVYQVEASALELLRAVGSKDWAKKLATYLQRVQPLKERYARERAMSLIPVTLAPGKTISLTPGGQNALIEKIVHEFCPRFTPNGRVLYVGDAGDKWAYFDEHQLENLGVRVDVHGKMPDVVVHHAEKGWLVLIEAVTSHGPVNAKRRGELKALFKDSTAGLVFVTAFLHRRGMVRYLSDISWETEVWVADSPSHLIHFNGERFLGPYSD